jgi:hypothetical protein
VDKDNEFPRERVVIWHSRPVGCRQSQVAQAVRSGPGTPRAFLVFMKAKFFSIFTCSFQMFSSSGIPENLSLHAVRQLIQ